MAAVPQKTYKELIAASQAELEDYQKQLIEMAKKATPFVVSSTRGSGKTRLAAAMAAGVRARSMIAPYLRYGTVIKPTLMNTQFPEETRHMVVGGSEGDVVIVALDLTPGTEDWARRYKHLVEDLTERWEIAEEAP